MIESIPSDGNLLNFTLPYRKIGKPLKSIFHLDHFAIFFNSNFW